MSELFEHRTVFVVDEYCNAVKERSIKQLKKDDAYCERFKRPIPMRFMTEREAWQFVLNRALAELAKKQNEVKKANARVKKCRQRLAESKS